MACLLYAWAEELPPHSAAWRRGTHKADSAAVCPGPHQDAGGPGRFNSWLKWVCTGDLNVQTMAGRSPDTDLPLLHLKIPENMTQNPSSVKERVRQGARQWERASANVRVKWCERWEVPYTRRVWCAWENELREKTGRWDSGHIQ